MTDKMRQNEIPEIRETLVIFLFFSTFLLTIELTSFVEMASLLLRTNAFAAVFVCLAAFSTAFHTNVTNEFQFRVCFQN